MEENKVASDKELRARAEKLADKLGLLPKPTPHVPYERMRNDIDLIFRELVAVRNATIKDVLRYETDVAAYEAYCAERGEKP